MSSSTQESQTIDDGPAGGQPSQPGIEQEIGHDEYDPVGTLALITIYFLIVVGLWIFTYFIEFLNNGPTVV